MGIAFITYFLHYPEEFDRVKRLVRRLLILTGMSILVLTVFHEWLSLFVYLFLVFLALLSVVVVITKIWFRAELKKYATGGQQ